jgi:serine/threonine protein kinase/Tfp pilus assembly protein PilF
MNKGPIVGSKPMQSLCAQCGSSLSSSEGTEEFCLTCLLHTALGGEDLDHAPRPHRFDQYELVSGRDGEPVELGRGAMGVTYRAFDTNLRCEVALKVIHPRYLADESSRARFLSEARAAAQLRHRNIASVFHLGSKRDEYFYAMELVEGQTIEEWVHHKGPIDCPIALDIALQITRALIATGTRQFVHRDVKPSNVMLCSEADGATVAKLIDFGLVRDGTDQSASASSSPVRQFAAANPSFGGSDGLVPRRVRTGFIGTPHFASPEQFAGKIADARSDIYSLGVTLWFMLTGKLPFDGTRDEIRQKQLSGALPLDQLKGIPHTVVDLIKRMLEADPAERPQSSAALKEQLNNCIATIDAAKQKQRRRFAYSALAAAVIITSILAASYILQRKFVPSAPSEVVPEKSIAVLPFQNLSGDPDNAYFGNGIQEEILTRLASIADLKVISRTSTQQYQSKPRNLREIAKQLGVANILEGSVQKAADQVRVNIQLINAQTDSHLWADTYDRKLTDIFGVESEIAKRIAESLQAKLTGREQRALAAKPTENPKAYDAYLRGLAHSLRTQRTPGNSVGAQKYLREAVQLDPKFALAWALLAYTDGVGYHTLNLQPTVALREEARQAAETALTLQPALGEAVLAKGYYHYACLKDYDTAVRYLEQAHLLLPNNSRILQSLADVERTRGQWDRSDAYFNEAERLDPRNVNLLTQHALSLIVVRRFPDALRRLDQVLDLTPDDVDTSAIKATIAQAEGDLPRAASLLAPLHPNAHDFGAWEILTYQAILDRHPAAIIARLKEILAEPDTAFGFYNGELRFWLGWAQQVAGDNAAAQQSWRQTRRELEPLLKEQPQNAELMSVLALANMGLGDKPAALALAEQAMAASPVEKDVVNGPFGLEILARVAAQTGESDRAIAALQKLLSIPYFGAFTTTPLTPALLRLDPMFDPLRGDPRFEKLCEEKQPVVSK